MSSTRSPRRCTSPPTARSASLTRPSFSAGFRSTPKCARPATASTWCRSATLPRSVITRAEIKAFAGSGNFWKIEVPTINPDTGEAATRKATPADRFPAPYPNETAARAANHNALPPDLSLITKAREGGAAYIHSLLTGYQPQPAELLKQFPNAKTPDGLYYNPYFANLNLAMPPPITSDGQVTYAEGSPPATVDQMSKDVSAFLVWTAEPKLENRHRTGYVVVFFLLFATILGYLSYKNIWAEAKRKVAPKGVLDPEHMAKREHAKKGKGIKG